MVYDSKLTYLTNTILVINISSDQFDFEYRINYNGRLSDNFKTLSRIILSGPHNNEEDTEGEFFAYGNPGDDDVIWLFNEGDEDYIRFEYGLRDNGRYIGDVPIEDNHRHFFLIINEENKNEISDIFDKISTDLKEYDPSIINPQHGRPVNKKNHRSVYWEKIFEEEERRERERKERRRRGEREDRFYL